MTDKTIAVAGNIGVGKTTLVRYLAERYDLVPLYEPFARNPYLDDFYQDMGAWAFHSQMWFLAHKYSLHKGAEATGAHGRPRLLDRTLYEDAEIFAAHLHREGHIDERDWGTYQELYRALRDALRPPDLLIHLTCSVDRMRQRIRERGRPAEQAIPPHYLHALDDLYRRWIRDWDRSPVLTWDTEARDYLEDLVDRIDFHKAIEAWL